MDTNRAIEILELLSGGMDPFTGELFPENSPYQHADTLRALFKAIDSLRKIQNKETRQKKTARKCWKVLE